MNLSQFQAELQAGQYSDAVPVQRQVGYQLDGHQHSFDACALIIAGEITLVIEGVASRYSVGDVFRLPAGTVHLESVGPDGVSYFSGRRESPAP